MAYYNLYFLLGSMYNPLCNPTNQDFFIEPNSQLIKIHQPELCCWNNFGAFPPKPNSYLLKGILTCEVGELIDQHLSSTQLPPKLPKKKTQGGRVPTYDPYK